MNCPNCGARVEVRRLLSEDLRHMSCAHCPAILAVETRLGLWPGLALIFLGVPLAKAVEAEWLSATAGLVVGVTVLLATAALGYRRSSTTLVRMRHERT